MLQRKQSLFLLAAVVLQLLSTQFNYFYAAILGVQYELDAFGFHNLSAINESTSDYKQVALVFAVAALCAVTIFQFKNRKLQLKLIKVAYLLQVVQFSYIFFSYYRLDEKNIGELELGVAPILIFVALAATIIAGKLIKKDDDLIKSVDRIR